MSSTYSPDLRIELIGTGDQAGVWGNTTNTNLSAVLESAIAGYTSVSVIAASQALTANFGAEDQARYAAIALTTTTGANFAVYAPPSSKLYVIYNASAYTATVYNSTVIGNTTAAGTGVAIPAGKTMTVWSDGTNFTQQNTHLNSPSFTTPALGTPASGTLTNATGLPVSTGISGLGTGVATFLATPSSANLAAALTDETGTGANVFATSPTLVTPILGTPTSATLTNATGLPIDGGTTGTLTVLRGGTGVTTSTGTGSVVLSASPTLSGTPSLPTGTTASTQTYGDSSTKLATTAFVQAAFQALYPIGSIYSSTVSTNPNTLFGFGTWAAYAAGRVMIGVGGGFAAAATGGSADAITVSHTHTYSSTTGGQSANHNHAISISDPTHSHTFIGGNSGSGGTVFQATSASLGTITTATSTSSVIAASTGITASSGNNSADHNHTVSGTTASTGASGTDANLQPYVVVYMWNRTA